MLVRVKLFAILRERAGAAEIDLHVPEESTVAHAARELVKRHPVLAPFRERIAYAVNRAYASPDVVLREGDELALIPPVSGG